MNNASAFLYSWGVSASIGSGDSRGVDRDTRREENEKTFRGGNAVLRDAAKKIGLKTDVPFMCECASIDCHGQVEVTIREWEAVAARPNHFLMIAGHQRSEGEEVVGSLREYEIARKPH
jgi:hypothetical protein